MDPSQADAIAHAILKPDAKVQEVLRRKRLAEEKARVQRRLIAVFVLPGILLGALIAHYSGHRFTEGGLWGGLAGALVGRAVAQWRRVAVSPADTT